MIPVAVALARFIEAHGFGGNYPYWYLGTTPVRFLTGPVVPLLLIGLRKIFSFFSYFDVVYVLLVMSFLASSVGWGILAAKLSKNKNIGVIVGILVLILPWRWLSALTMAEPSIVFAKNLLPWGILSMSYYFTHKKIFTLILAILSVSFILLIHTAVLFPLVVGIAGLFIATREGKEDEEGEENLVDFGKQAFFILGSALVLITLWYTPGFWWRVSMNLSIGGAAGLLALVNAVNFLKIFLPVASAILVLSFLKKESSPLAKFSLVWLLTFGGLTLFRFFANPNFWMDWTSWFFELEIGIALLGCATLKKPVWWAMLLLPIILSVFIYGKLGTPALISSQLPTGIGSLVKLHELAGDKRVFLSGSTVFWANSLFDLSQVRGGRDEVAVDKRWRRVAYEMREGTDPQRTITLAKNLGVSYVLVHGSTSPEYYHDFKHVEKWESIGRKIWEERGDVIYSID